jgi:hypothetical protein
LSRRFYSNTANAGTITASLNNTDSTTSVTLSSGALSSWPSTPCTAAINLGQADEEIVLVTAYSGTSVTFTRGYDGSPVREHNAGSTLTHVSVAKDYDEANSHTNASSGVHGITGSVVGTSDTQTLSGKTLTTPTIGDFTNAQHDHSGMSKGGIIPQSSVSGLPASLTAKQDASNAVTTDGTQTISGAKTFSAAVTAGAGLDVTGALTGDVNSGNTFPTVVDNTGTAVNGVVAHVAKVAFTLSNTAGTTVTYSLSGLSLSSILCIQATVEVGSLFRIDTNLNSYDTSSISIRVRESENAAVTITGTIHLMVIGTR